MLYLYLRGWYQECTRKKEQLFREQFKEGIQAMLTALNVGYSVENAIHEAKKDMCALYKKKNRMMKELDIMTHQLEVNLSVEEVLLQFASRVHSEDVENFVKVFSIAKRMGGNSIEIIQNAVDIIGEKTEVEREIQTILASKKLEFQIMCVIPFCIIFYMRSAFPEFMSVLYGNFIGVIFMTICLLLYMAAYNIGKKIVQIEV
ncbi:MAG: type II secretion system F family protein [Candidatus Ruminococcus intestinipullorum]|nr:type II secretion system F family protein [Candidatus Ruminococcus intestinipullorum]